MVKILRTRPRSRSPRCAAPLRTAAAHRCAPPSACSAISHQNKQILHAASRAAWFPLGAFTVKMKNNNNHLFCARSAFVRVFAHIASICWSQLVVDKRLSLSRSLPLSLPLSLFLSLCLSVFPSPAVRSPSSLSPPPPTSDESSPSPPSPPALFLFK